MSTTDRSKKPATSPLGVDLHRPLLRPAILVGPLSKTAATRRQHYVCEWAHENYGPEGAMYPGLIRSRRVRPADPDATSSVPPPNLQRQAPLPPRGPLGL